MTQEEIEKNKYMPKPSQAADPNRYRQIPSAGLEPEDDEPRRKRGGDINWTSFLISVVVALVVVMVMNSIVMPVASKKAYQADITRLELNLLDIGKVNTDLTGRTKVLEDNVKTLINTVTTQIATALQDINTKTTQLENSVNQKVSNFVTADVLNNTVQTNANTLRTEIANVKSDLTSLSGTINSKIENEITAQLKDITARIVKLETPPPPPQETTGGLTLKLKKSSDSLIPVDDPLTESDNTSLLQATFKIILTNTTEDDIEDVILNISLQTEDIPNVTGRDLVSNPSMSWTTSGWFSFSAEYINSWGLSIEAGKSKTIYVTLTIRGKDSNPFTRGYGYNISAQVSD